MAVAVADRAAERQRDRHRAEVQRDQRRHRVRAERELAHDVGQGDREHRRVERDEDGAARDPEHRRREQATVGPVPPGVPGRGHRSRTVPAVPSISTIRPSAILSRRARDADDRRQPELTRDDGGMREHPAGIRDEAAGDREDRHPRRVRRRADDDVARAGCARSPPSPSATRAGPRTTPAEAPVPLSSSASPASSRATSKRLVTPKSGSARPSLLGGLSVRCRACSARRSATVALAIRRGSQERRRPRRDGGTGRRPARRSTPSRTSRLPTRNASLRRWACDIRSIQ